MSTHMLQNEGAPEGGELGRKLDRNFELEVTSGSGDFLLEELDDTPQIDQEHKEKILSKIDSLGGRHIHEIEYGQLADVVKNIIELSIGKPLNSSEETTFRTRFSQAHQVLHQETDHSGKIFARERDSINADMDFSRLMKNRLIGLLDEDNNRIVNTAFEEFSPHSEGKKRVNLEVLRLLTLMVSLEAHSREEFDTRRKANEQ